MSRKSGNRFSEKDMGERKNALRRLLSAVALAAICATSWAISAAAQGYPNKPITVVIPLAAGGAVDTTVRAMIEPMRTVLGQSILVENMGGAGGTTGVARVARAAPDGYTISVGTWGTHVVNAFAQTNAGDMSPNVPDATRGPTPDDVENCRIIGERQYAAARGLVDGAGDDVGAGITVRLTHVRLAGLDVDSRWCPDGRAHRTGRAVLGAAFAAGTKEGPGAAFCGGT